MTLTVPVCMQGGEENIIYATSEQRHYAFRCCTCIIRKEYILFLVSDFFLMTLTN
uniref:Uncharacterized protein n=1 Tax=Anguilla anguilla TaxID=7936 RepID=A0A0E9RET8_ANGAN